MSSAGITPCGNRLSSERQNNIQELPDDVKTFLQKTAKPSVSDRLLFADLFLPALVAHGNVAVIPAEEDLPAFGHDLSVFVYPRVDGCFPAAGTDGFDLRQ